MSLSDFIPPPTDTWGPTKIDPVHTFVPVEFVGRTEKLGRFCDFTSGGLRTRRGDGEGEEFKFVDSRTAGARKQKFAPLTAQYQYSNRGRQWGGRQGSTFAGRGGRGGQWGGVRIDHRTGKPVPVRQSAAKAGAFKPHWQRGGPSNIVKGIREWSTPIKPEYTLLSEVSLGQVGKRTVGTAKTEWFVSDANKVEFEDLLKCGEIAHYDKSFDKIPARQPKPLAKAEHVNFYNVTTGQDPVMEELITRAIQGSAAESAGGFLVACTDQVLAALMTASRSVYSWDLVITRNGNTILIDKRDSSPLDFLSVSENAAPNDQPSFDENLDPQTQINSPVKLGLEATAINQNVSQQVLAEAAGEVLEYPNPFYDDEEETTMDKPARTAYLYRKAFIPASANGSGKEWNFIIRGEANAKLEDGKLVTVKALNEFDPKVTCWREHFEKSREAAVFATEMKNNACKLARWLASAVISGCEILKLGFVSRRSEDDPWNHSLLSVQTHNVKDLLTQSSISVQSMWSSVCALLAQVVATSEETEKVGRYLLVKDPSKPSLALYQIPWDEFEGDEEEDGEEEEFEDDDQEAE